MKRLPKGYGSVYNLSGSRRKPYVARVTVGLKADGRPDYRYLGYYAKADETILALTEYNKNPSDIDARKATVADMWDIFKQRRFPVISESGKSVYTAAFGHLKPIQDRPIADLRTYELQSLIDGIDRKWQTKSHVQTLLHQLFNIACELDIATKNYAGFIKLGSKNKSEKHTMFTSEEIQKLFECVFYEPWADTVLIMIYTGMRPSEMLGMKLEDINLSEKYMKGGIKTAAGKGRIIPIHSKIMPFVIKRYNAGKIFLIEENSKPVDYHVYAKRFKELMERLGLNHLPHDGRHTFASMANTAGVNPVSVKLIMGHASGDITERVYTHKEINELSAAVNML